MQYRIPYDQEHYMDLREEQLKIEREAADLGILRYRRQREAGEENTGVGRRFIKSSLEGFAETIREYVDETLAGKAGRSAGVALYLAQFTPEQVAMVTLSAVVHSIPKRSVRLQAIAMGIANTLSQTRLWDTLAEEQPGLYKRLLRRIKESGTAEEGYRWLLVRRWSAKAGIKQVKWGKAEELRLGTVLLHLLAGSTDYIAIETVRHGRETVTEVRPTEALVDWVERSHAAGEALASVNLPMVCPPIPWTNPKDGGYLVRRLPLVTNVTKEHLAELRGWEMPAVYSAINALQDTRWAINRPILDVVKQCYERNVDVSGIVRKDPLELPPKTFSDPEAEPEKFAAWKVVAAGVYRTNALLKAKRLEVINKVWTAERFADYDAFHFVYQLDFRGRAYVRSDYLSPQADDLSKGLLQFADGKPLGQYGAYWLAVHIANTYGIDKVPFDDRVQWVQDNTDMIVSCAMCPLDDLRWTAADGGDKPWQFLAAAREWLGLTLHCNSGGDAADYVSHLPVGLDGSCNGLQHYSMALRDEIGGAAVNLIPCDKPADIYSEVATLVRKQVEEDAAAGNPPAIAWRDKVSRKVCKRPTMTLPYGSGRFGFVDQTLEVFHEYARKHGKPYLGEGVEEYPAALYFASTIDDAIGATVVKAREAMQWLQKVSRVVAKQGLPIRYEAPSGFLVAQDYRQVEGKVCDFTVRGHRYNLTLQVTGTKTDARRMANGIAPNFVHSLDAAHLVATINSCTEAGLNAFAMVHDSYGVHACDIDELSYRLRKAFVEQYRDNVLERFREQVLEQITDPKVLKQIPPVPAYGTLDPEAVMDAHYFFA